MFCCGLGCFVTREFLTPLYRGSVTESLTLIQSARVQYTNSGTAIAMFLFSRMYCIPTEERP